MFDAIKKISQVVNGKIINLFGKIVNRHHGHTADHSLIQDLFKTHNTLEVSWCKIKFLQLLLLIISIIITEKIVITLDSFYSIKRRKIEAVAILDIVKLAQ